MMFVCTLRGSQLPTSIIQFFYILIFAVGYLVTAEASAQGQNRAMTTVRDLAEIKAECQRVAKLYIERTTGRDSDRLTRRMARATAELEEYSMHAPAWIQTGLPAEKSNEVVADVKQLISMAKSAKPSETVAVIAVADRCSKDADAMMQEVRGGAANSKAVQLTARALYLSQRAVRDAILMANRIKAPGVSAEVLTKESDELTAVLREIATLPSTPGMKTSLDLANNQWTLVRPSLARGASSPESLDLALRASERMFEALDELFDEVAKAALAFN